MTVTSALSDDLKDQPSRLQCRALPQILFKLFIRNFTICSSLFCPDWPVAWASPSYSCSNMHCPGCVSLRHPSVKASDWLIHILHQNKKVYAGNLTLGTSPNTLPVARWLFCQISMLIQLSWFHHCWSELELIKTLSTAESHWYVSIPHCRQKPNVSGCQWIFDKWKRGYRDFSGGCLLILEHINLSCWHFRVLQHSLWEELQCTVFSLNHQCLETFTPTIITLLEVWNLHFTSTVTLPLCMNRFWFMCESCVPVSHLSG